MTVIAPTLRRLSRACRHAAGVVLPAGSR